MNVHVWEITAGIVGVLLTLVVPTTRKVIVETFRNPTKKAQLVRDERGVRVEHTGGSQVHIA